MTLLSKVVLTDEQEEVKSVILSGKSCVVNACPGAGKTTLSLIVIRDFIKVLNREALLLTFSSKLKDETRDKIKENNINCRVHSYNSAPRDHYLLDAINDEDIYDILTKDISPMKNSYVKYDLIVLDEVQDMTKMHYKYLMKFIKDMDMKPLFLIIGDVDQSIFQFKGADSRYLTMCDELFPGEFIEKTLTETFRLTGNMVSFINEVIFGYTKYKPKKSKGKKVTYIKCDTYDNELFEYLVKRIKEYDINDVYIEAPSIVSDKIPIKRFENFIANNHKEIPVHIPKSDNDYTNDTSCENKIAMTNYHKVKGSEKSLTIIFGFDESYYKFYADEKDPRDHITNPMLVGITRAHTELILIQAANEDPLPFLKMKLETLKTKDYCKVRDRGSPKTININRDKPHTIAVTKLINHLSQENEMLLYPLINDSGIFKVISRETTNIRIPSDIKICNITEDISHLNGVAIPTYFEYLMNNELSLYDFVKSKNKRRGLISREIFKLPDKNDFTIKDYLRLANIRESIMSGCLSNLNQISDYSWLKKYHVDACIKNMNEVIKDEILEFEIPISYRFNHDKYGDIQLIGYIDISSDDNIYEIKCTDKLTLTNKLQIIVYAYMWKKQYPDDQKKFYLFNVRTSEVLELDYERGEIDEIMDIIIENKIKKYESISNKEFLKKNQEPIQLSDINEDLSDLEPRRKDPLEEYAFIDED